MKIYNEETTPGQKSGTILILENCREARTLIDMAEAASESNKRKTTWKKITDQLKAEVYAY